MAPLLFGSGLCALVYQTVWLREFRLIFGASTAASAAVLAIFMAGLGLGSALLGARADRQARPLAFYANLELLIAASAALSPFLVEAVRAIYIALGGTPVMGLGLGTVVRLVLSLLVLAVPTVLMGGTLPAAARAVLSDEDPHRRDLALLYGINTLGAVTGAVASTFLLLEVLGNRSTLWSACLLLALIQISEPT
ncbi:fused MFS/spermidine synthase, partial [Corallococcus exercitus]|uniref:fused MFS/spermidine synthase n=1 Tax=Corallococcus exercitus TaxID=2316736 RepID=UPI001FC98AAB